MNYALDSPLNRKVYVPGEDDVSFAPVSYPSRNSEIDQTHRRMNWLFHKPQDQISTRPQETRNTKKSK
jgi:hypothetical protein